LEEINGDLELEASYVYGHDIDQPLVMQRNGDSYFYHRHILNNIFALTNEAGQLSESYEHTVFGTTLILDSDDSPLHISAISNPYQHTGRRHDIESGNQYYRIRYFTPQLGRFLQTDPLGYVDGLNSYRYVRNNPLKWNDPLGLSSDIGTVVGAMVGGSNQGFRTPIGRFMTGSNIMTGSSILDIAPDLFNYFEKKNEINAQIADYEKQLIGTPPGSSPDETQDPCDTSYVPTPSPISQKPITPYAQSPDSNSSKTATLPKNNTSSNINNPMLNQRFNPANHLNNEIVFPIQYQGKSNRRRGGFRIRIIIFACTEEARTLPFHPEFERCHQQNLPLLMPVYNTNSVISLGISNTVE